MLNLLVLILAVTLPADPPATRTIEFEERWRTDPYSDEYLMGYVTNATIDDEGNYYFLDTQLQEVFKFDSEGNFIDTVARKGEGPGELDQTWRIAWWSPDALVLPRVFPPRIIRVSPDGVPLEELHVYRKPGDDSKASVSSLVPVGDQAIVRGSMFQFSPDGSRSLQWIGLIDRAGTVLHEFGELERELSSDPLNQVVDEAAEFWDWGRWAVSSAGHIYRAPDREKWLIERYDLAGNLTGTWERDVPARSRTEEEYEDMKGQRSFVFNGQKADITYKLLDTESPVASLRVVGDRLWVYHNPAPDELPEDIWQRVSVLTLDGDYIEDLDLVVDFDEELDTAALLPNGWLMIVENGVAARESAFAGFGDEEGAEEDEDLSDAEPAEIVIYAPKN
jgi:hypothetical protein